MRSPLRFRREQAEPAAPTPRVNGGLGAITFPVPGVAVSREQAMALSVVANARHIICGIAAQLTVTRSRGADELPPGTLLTQPDPDETWPETIGWTVDDLFFYGESSWLVLRRDAESYPTRARRLPPGSVHVELTPDYSKLSRIVRITAGSAEIAPRDVIRIGAPHRGLLREAAQPILSALELQAAAERFSKVPLPAGTLTNTGQEIGPEDAKGIVDAFDAARELGATAFLQGMTYERTQLNAADLQLVESRAAWDTVLARLCNVPVASVGASPSGGATAQLYANVGQTLTQLVQQAVAPYLVAIEHALTYQATPSGQSVQFDTEDWLRFALISQPAATSSAPATPGGTPQ